MNLLHLAKNPLLTSKLLFLEMIKKMTKKILKKKILKNPGQDHGPDRIHEGVGVDRVIVGPPEVPHRDDGNFRRYLKKSACQN